MKEVILNLFLFIDENDLIEKIGVVPHEIDGDDNDKMSFLSVSVESDLKNVKIFNLSENFQVVDVNTKQRRTRCISYATYNEMRRNGDTRIFEEIFQYYNAPMSPLTCITPIKNGKIRVDSRERA
jgi:hypothetical protein